MQSTLCRMDICLKQTPTVWCLLFLHVFVKLSITLTLLKSDSPYGLVLGGVNLVPRAFFLNRKGKGKREKALETRLKFFGSLTVSV